MTKATAKKLVIAYRASLLYNDEMLALFDRFADKGNAWQQLRDVADELTDADLKRAGVDSTYPDANKVIDSVLKNLEK